MLEILVSGRAQNIFAYDLAPLDDADAALYRAAEDVFEWLESTKRVAESEEILARAVTQGLLGDSCHFIYEAVSCARKGKTTVAFGLLRKPFVDNLFLLEQLLVDPSAFCSNLKADPLRLRPKMLSSPALKASHVEAAVKALGANGVCFNAPFLTQLRFDKGAEDSFEPLWNKALHVVTAYDAIKTEPMNLNFVFSDAESVASQQAYFFARVPYLLTYFRAVVEALVARFAVTPADYRQHVDVRLAAGAVLWARRLEGRLLAEPILRFANTWGWMLKRLGETTAPSQSRLKALFDGAVMPGDPPTAARTRPRRPSSRLR